MKITFSKVDLHQVPNKREKIIFALTIAAFCIVFLRSCWVPSRRAISSVKTEIEDIRSDYDTLKKAGMAGDRLGTKRLHKGPVEIKEEYIQWARRLADAPDAYIMREFSNPVTLRDVKIEGIEFTKVDNKKGITERKYTMSLYGPFTSMGAYLDRLENLPMLMIIDSIEISSAGGPLGRVNVDLTGVVYGWK